MYVSQQSVTCLLAADYQKRKTNALRESFQLSDKWAEHSFRAARETSNPVWSQQGVRHYPELIEDAQLAQSVTEEGNKHARSEFYFYSCYICDLVALSSGH